MKNFSILLILLASLSACEKNGVESEPSDSAIPGQSGAKISATASACETPGNAAKVICLTESFKASLTASQLASLQTPLTKASASKWSHLTGGVSIRNGLEFSSLSSSQLAAAKAIISTAMGITVNEGSDEFNQINLGDAALGSIGGSNYSSGKYVIAILGEPSLTGTWMLQVGGHNYAQNITYSNGVVVSATPSMQGIEPKNWTFAQTSYSPLAQEHMALTTLFASMTASDLATAKMSSTDTDLMLGAGKDGQFPSTKAGVRLGSLSSQVQTNFKNALLPWLNDFDNDMKVKLQTIYTNELADTYLSYSGNATAMAGNPNSFLMKDGDYVRIDGPSIWLEFIVKKGSLYVNDVQYHTVLRDHTRDYNGM